MTTSATLPPVPASAPGPTRASGRRGSSRDLAGTGTLLRLALRRDRVTTTVWVAALGLTVTSTANAITTVYATAADRAGVARDTNANGSLRALYGPVLHDSIGGLTAWRVGAFVPAFAAIMSLLIVVRHTREEEENGRQEALSACMVGRRAGLTSALLAAVVANAALALLIAAGMAGLGQGGPGALALGLVSGAVGMAFAGLAAVAAQLTENARLARGMTAGVLGVAFVLRMAGDAAKDAATGSSHWLVWVSPLGWAENVRPYAGERWWALLLIAALAAAAVALAYTLAGRRDVGAGFFPARPGPASAGRGLTGAYGLAWRLQRGSLVGWAIGFAFAGAVLGAVSNGAQALVGNNAQTREIVERMGGQQSLTDSFIAAMVGMLGLACAVYAAGAVLRLRTEETGYRAEPLLAGAVGRVRWAASHLVVGCAGSTVLLAVGGLAVGAGYGTATGDPGGQLARGLGAALAQLPAVWVLAGLAMLLVGAAPRWATATWGLVGVVVGIGWLGAALDLPQWAMDLSPFEHLPKLPGGAVTAGPYVWLTLFAALATAGGLAGMRRRDIGG